MTKTLVASDEPERREWLLVPTTTTTTTAGWVTVTPVRPEAKERPMGEG